MAMKKVSYVGVYIGYIIVNWVTTNAFIARIWYLDSMNASADRTI